MTGLPSQLSWPIVTALGWSCAILFIAAISSPCCSWVASSPSVKSWMLVPSLTTWNVIVSPALTVKSAGLKTRSLVVTISMVRSALAVPAGSPKANSSWVAGLRVSDPGRRIGIRVVMPKTPRVRVAYNPT